MSVSEVVDGMFDVICRRQYVEFRNGQTDKAYWIVRRISEFGSYDNGIYFVKVDMFEFNIDCVRGSARFLCNKKDFYD